MIDEEETYWEIWQDDLLVATSTHERDAHHYALVYSEDGPAQMFKVSLRREEVQPVVTYAR